VCFCVALCTEEKELTSAEQGQNSESPSSSASVSPRRCCSSLVKKGKNYQERDQGPVLFDRMLCLNRLETPRSISSLKLVREISCMSIKHMGGASNCLVTSICKHFVLQLTAIATHWNLECDFGNGALQKKSGKCQKVGSSTFFCPVFSVEAS